MHKIFRAVLTGEAMDQVTNAFDTSVAAPKSPKAWKPIAQMDAAERRLYNKDRAAASRAKRKKADELAAEAKQFAEDEEKQRYKPEIVDTEYQPIPQKWQDAFDSFLDQDDTLDKVAKELNRSWLYSDDTQMIRDLQKLIFAVEHKCFQTDGGQIRTLGEFPDVIMQQAIKNLEARPHFNAESDAIDLRKSPTFMGLYTDSLWKSNTIGCDPKFTPLLDGRMWSTVRAEFQRVCQD